MIVSVSMWCAPSGYPPERHCPQGCRWCACSAFNRTAHMLQRGWNATIRYYRNHPAVFDYVRS